MDIKAIESMNEMLDVQGASGNWDYSEYMHGMFNGMEFMASIAEDRAPAFRDSPKEWGKDGQEDMIVCES